MKGRLRSRSADGLSRVGDRRRAAGSAFASESGGGARLRLAAILNRAGKATPVAGLFQLGLAVQILPVVHVVIFVHVVGAGTLVALPRGSPDGRRARIDAPGRGLPSRGRRRDRGRVALEGHGGHDGQRSHPLLEAAATRCRLRVRRGKQGTACGLLVGGRRRFELILFARGAAVVVCVRILQRQVDARRSAVSNGAGPSRAASRRRLSRVAVTVVKHTRGRSSCISTKVALTCGSQNGLGTVQDLVDAFALEEQLVP